MKLHLRIWRQQNSQAEGHFGEYDLDGVREDMSFLEMLDVLNEQLIDSGNEPVAFDSDCREGVCGIRGEDAYFGHTNTRIASQRLDSIQQPLLVMVCWRFDDPGASPALGHKLGQQQ